MIWKSQTSKCRFRNRYKYDLETSPNKKWNFKVLELKKLIYTGPKITQKSNKIMFFTISSPSCCPHGPPGCQNGPPGCAQGAKMAPQGAPEMPKWSPRMSKMEAQSPLNGNPRSQKGPAAAEVALIYIIRFAPQNINNKTRATDYQLWDSCHRIPTIRFVPQRTNIKIG